MIKVNLGSGPNGITGWDNLDWGILPFISKFKAIRDILIKINLISKDYSIEWPKIRLVDIRNKLPYKDSSVDYIYCSHVLEHFEEYEAIKILYECRRILKTNGVLRIVLPDLNKIIAGYINSEEFCNDFFGYHKKEFSNVKRYFIRGHQWMYDQPTFENILKNVGFCNIKKFSIKKGNCQDIDKLDYEGHQKISMYFECQKSS